MIGPLPMGTNSFQRKLILFSDFFCLGVTLPAVSTAHFTRLLCKGFSLTWIGHLDDLCPLDAGEVGCDAGLEWLQLEEGEEVGDEADQVEADRVVQVDKVLDAQVAAVEGQRRRAEPLHQLQAE